MKVYLKSTIFFLATMAFANANEFQSELEALANGRAMEVASSSEVIEAVKAQNMETSGYDQAKIDELDKAWRAEADAADQPLMDKLLENDLSAYLADVQSESGGLFTEIFVMDAKGLNVGQSDVTSDYWQGDEAKWKKTFLVGKGAVHVGDLEKDDSTQMLQSQVSIPVTDPDTGENIGAVTFGVNVENL
jgi:sensor histidine kinase regulating citrate/malate metabolism